MGDPISLSIMGIIGLVGLLTSGAGLYVTLKDKGKGRDPVPSCHQFRCPSSKCIPWSYKCDGDNDCGDNFDELGCARSCTSSEFRCRKDQCIPLSYKCDGDNDCGDNSDERGCVPSCTSSQFRCPNGQCKPLSYKCDGDNDCGDNSDERGCYRRPTTPTPRIRTTTMSWQKKRALERFQEFVNKHVVDSTDVTKMLEVMDILGRRINTFMLIHGTNALRMENLFRGRIRRTPPTDIAMNCYCSNIPITIWHTDEEIGMHMVQDQCKVIVCKVQGFPVHFDGFDVDTCGSAIRNIINPLLPSNRYSKHKGVC